MKNSISQIIPVLGHVQMETLRRDGCGLINCRSRQNRRRSVHEEIQNILDARSSSWQQGIST